ncbi:hypothetical protein L7F22_008278 [Adiantum nelumboides]|nr:hypothetical protein [Adiantum nelumboides]
MGDEYEMGTMVGMGAYGVVRRCVKRATGQEYACKSSNDKKAANNEIALLARVQGHPNVVRLEAHCHSQDSVHLLLELCHGGDLLEHIETLRAARSLGPDHQGAVLSEAEAAEALLAVVLALSFCHSRGVMHRDIKPENLLLPRPDSRLSALKLADFGVAADIATIKTLDDMVVGTYDYQAPEVLSDEIYNEKVDVWSLGVVLYLLLRDQSPFGCSTGPHEVQEASFSPELLYQLENSQPPISHHAKDLLINLLQVNPTKRLDFKSILMHPWIFPVLPHALLNYDEFLTSRSSRDDIDGLKFCSSQPPVLMDVPHKIQVRLRVKTKQTKKIRKKLLHQRALVGLRNQLSTISSSPSHFSLSICKNLSQHVTEWLNKH